MKKKGNKINEHQYRNTQDALRNTVTTSYYTDGMMLTESKTDTVYHDSSKLATHSDIKVSKVMSTADGLKNSVIVFIMIIYVTMVWAYRRFFVEMFYENSLYINVITLSSAMVYLADLLHSLQPCSLQFTRMTNW